MLRVLFQDEAFCCGVAEHVDPKLFDSRACRWLAETIVSHARTQGCGASIDAVQMKLVRAKRAGRLRDRDAEEADLLVKRLRKPASDRTFVREELFRFVKNQIVEKSILASLDFVQAGDFESVDAEINKILQVNAAKDGGLGSFYVRDVEKRTLLRKNYVPNGIPTGLKVDQYTRAGGLWPKAVGAWVSGTGRGKSQCLVNMGRQAALADKKVLHVTCELPEENILDRYDASFFELGLNSLEDKADEIEGLVRELGSQRGDFLVVKEYPSVTLTVPMLRTYVRQLEATAFYPDMLIVDYAGEMLPSVSKDNTYEDRGNIFRELRKLAFELNVPIWTALQTNRAGLDRETIDLQHLAESIQPAMVSDMLLFFCQTAEEKKKRKARVFVGKNRGGPDRWDFGVIADWDKSLLRDAERRTGGRKWAN